ncbi:MAG: transposase [bacterium]|nr:transposase [bacterium]
MKKNQEEFKQIKKSELIAVGVDVAMETLAICFRYKDKDKFEEIKNNKTEIKRLAGKLSKDNFKGKVIMESTGRHHLQTALTLSENNLDVRVINPLISKKYSNSAIRKVKTDKRDSQILAEIAIKEEKLPSRFNLGKNEITIKKKVSLIAFLDKEIQKMNSSINEYIRNSEELGLKLSKTDKQIKRTVDLLKDQKKELEKEVEKMISDCKCNADEIEKYSSIPGVSSYTASVSSLFFSGDYNLSAKQWIAFAGLDVSVRESGAWRGRGKLTKRGNAYLRKKLFQAAWGAKMHDDNFKKYYNRLRGEGRPYVEALIIIARKLVVIMFNLNNNNERYDASKTSFLTA